MGMGGAHFFGGFSFMLLYFYVTLFLLLYKLSITIPIPNYFNYLNFYLYNNINIKLLHIYHKKVIN